MDLKAELLEFLEELGRVSDVCTHGSLARDCDICFWQKEAKELEAERDRLKAQLDIAVESLRDIAEYEFTAGYKAQQAAGAD